MEGGEGGQHALRECHDAAGEQLWVPCAELEELMVGLGRHAHDTLCD